MLNNQITVNHWGHAFDMKHKFHYKSVMYMFWLRVEEFYASKITSCF